MMNGYRGEIESKSIAKTQEVQSSRRDKCMHDLQVFVLGLGMLWYHGTSIPTSSEDLNETKQVFKLIINKVESLGTYDTGKCGIRKI